MKKLILITGAILTAYLLLIYFATPFAAPSYEAAAQPYLPAYTVAESDGRVAVFKDGEIFMTTDTPVSSLPKSDINRLQKGIPVPDQRELKKLLQDLCS